jgi:hypothetical protein
VFVSFVDYDIIIIDPLVIVLDSVWNQKDFIAVLLH